MNTRISNRPAALPHITTMSPLRGIAYWLISAPVLAETIAGAQWDLTRTPYVSDTLVHLGYPLYLLTIMGVAKVLAVAALLAPGWPRLKEWAYAGIVFVYLGAACSHFAVGDPTDKVVVPTIFAVVALLSWAMRPPARRDPSPLELSWLRSNLSRVWEHQEASHDTSH